MATVSIARNTVMGVRYVHLASIGMTLAMGVSRVLFVRDTPINWDSVQFSLALGNFDLHSHQPHPPGYILYVALGRVLNALLGDPTLALCLLSVLFSAASTPLLYWLALAIFEDDVIALGSALLLLGSPLALYYGSVGLTYVPEMALGIVVAWLAWNLRANHGSHAPLWLGLALGISGGIRQTTLLLLLPLCAWALWRKPPRQWLLFGLSCAITCALWLVPLLVLSGGPAAYLRESALQAKQVSDLTSIVGTGIEGPLYNLTFEALALGAGLAFALIPLGLWALRMVRFTLRRELKGFLVCWTLPSLALFAAGHVGQFGYLLVVLPPLILLSSLSARALAQRLLRAGGEHRRASWATTVCGSAALLSAAYFLFAGGPVTASDIIKNDLHRKALSAALSTMPPRETALVMDVNWSSPFRMSGYLLPDYYAFAIGKDDKKTIGVLYAAYGGRSTYALPRPAALRYLPLPVDTHRVVALDSLTADRMAGDKGAGAVSLTDGTTLYVLYSPMLAIQGLAFSGDKMTAVYEQAASRYPTDIEAQRGMISGNSR